MTNSITDLFDLSHTIAGEYLQKFENPWQALPKLQQQIVAIGETLGGEFIQILPQVWVHKSAKIAPSANITGPCIIGRNSEVRHCAYIRTSCIIGDSCVVGSAVELKNVILFDNVQVAHLNYVGDSILGHQSHMAAGAITSNVKLNKTNILINLNGKIIDTHLKKLGALAGDNVQIGCNSVLNPATIIGRNTTIYPLSNVRGVIPANSIFKSLNNIIEKR
jgi:NDP-sugar pyrophosphorylase family protein